jgi:large subunit ribosomal protein L15e
MTKSSYSYISAAWKKPRLLSAQKARIVAWRKTETVERVDKPTRIDRARALGYKAKQGYAIARVRVKKGGRRRKAYHRGRKPTHAGLIHFTPTKSKRWNAEEKAGRKFNNLEVLNSYEVGGDGQYLYFEVILVDPNHPNIKSDPKINWICSKRRRAVHGLTSAGKKARGL